MTTPYEVPFGLGDDDDDDDVPSEQKDYEFYQMKEIYVSDTTVISCLDCILPLEMHCRQCRNFRAACMRGEDRHNPDVWPSYHEARKGYVSGTYMCNKPGDKEKYEQKRRCANVNAFVEEFRVFKSLQGQQVEIAHSWTSWSPERAKGRDPLPRQPSWTYSTFAWNGQQETFSDELSFEDDHDLNDRHFIEETTSSTDTFHDGPTTSAVDPPEERREQWCQEVLAPPPVVEVTTRPVSKRSLLSRLDTFDTDEEEDSDNTTKESHDPTFWAKSEAYFFNHGANIAFLGLLVASNICMALWGASEFTEPTWSTTSDVLRVTLPIARAAGRLVTWNSALILVSACKYMWTLVRLTPIALGFPVDNVMPYYHRIIAATIIVMGCVVHSIPQVVNYASRAITVNEGGPVWTRGNGFATRQLLITGTILFVVFAAFYVTTLERVRRTSLGFRLFWISHVIGIATALPLLLIHGTVRGTPITLYFTALPICLYGIDSFLRRLVFNSLDAALLGWSAHDDGGDKVVKLEIQSKSFQYCPGQYAELNIPEISRFEWHPFTVASAPNNDGKVVFHIKSAGKWTSALFDLGLTTFTQQAKATKEDP